MPSLSTVAILLAFYSLLVAEFMIPSGGVLGVAAVTMGVTAIIVGWTQSTAIGMGVAATEIITTPIILYFLIRLWPKTSIGRQMLNRDDREAMAVPVVKTTVDGVALETLVGQTGVAASNLLPSGQIKVDGHKADAVSTGQAIDCGDSVIVVRLQAGKLQVRKATQSELKAAASVSTASSALTASSGPADEMTESQPTETQTQLDSLLEDVDLDEL